MKSKSLTCAEAMQEFFAYLDRALSGEPLEAFEAHIEQCLSCCDKLAFSRQIDAFVKERLRGSPPPAGLEERIRQALRHIKSNS